MREEQGYSQESFADHCGLHRTYISGIERGVRNPTVIILDKIAKALKVPAGQLLEEARSTHEEVVAPQGSRQIARRNVAPCLIVPRV